MTKSRMEDAWDYHYLDSGSLAIVTTPSRFTMSLSSFLFCRSLVLFFRFPSPSTLIWSIRWSKAALSSWSLRFPAQCSGGRWRGWKTRGYIILGASALHTHEYWTDLMPLLRYAFTLEVLILPWYQFRLCCEVLCGMIKANDDRRRETPNNELKGLRLLIPNCLPIGKFTKVKLLIRSQQLMGEHEMLLDGD